MDTKSLRVDVRLRLKEMNSSLSAESINLGWSKNRLGQILKQEMIEVKTFGNICEHFSLDVYDYVGDNFFPYFWKVKHLVSDSSFKYEKTIKVQPGGVYEIYGDQPIKFSAWGRHYDFPDGCSFIVTKIKGAIEPSSLYVIAQKIGDSFKVVRGDAMKKPAIKFRLISILVQGARPLE